jgi:hypothetical protein
MILLKRSMLGLWSLWWTLVVATNLADAGKALGLVAETWRFASGNYQLIAETTARYGTPAWCNGVLFFGVICWEGVATFLFWRAFWRFRGRSIGRPLLYPAFTAGLTLWLAFLVADEFFIAFALTGTHLRLFIAQLGTLLAIEFLPDV